MKQHKENFRICSVLELAVRNSFVTASQDNLQIVVKDFPEVTHFSGYKTITIHEKAMLYVLNHDFSFFAY